MIATIDDFKKRVSTEADILTIFSDINPKKYGRIYKAKCPFHSENTPSFIINIKEGVILYKCFGCGESGDIVTYISKKNNLDRHNYDDLKKIFDIISNLTGVASPIVDKKYCTKIEMEFENYHKNLLNNKSAIEHLENRGVIDLSLFGYDNETYKILSQHLNNYYIIDYKPNSETKYKFPHGMSKDIPFLFQKVRDTKEIYLVEGIFDALTLREHLNLNAVALLGSELKNQTLKYLKRFENIIICLDNDKAGREGTEKIINKLYRNDFLNVFYVDLNNFDFKDFNDCYQSIGKSNFSSIGNYLKANIKSAYRYLLDEHKKQITRVINDLDNIKITNTFANNILEYNAIIQNQILKEYKNIFNNDLTQLVNHYKGLLAVEDFRTKVSYIIDNDNFNVNSINEIEKLSKESVSTTLNISIHSVEEIKRTESSNYINSELIKDEIKYYEGALSFIGARTGHGKTTFMINEAIRLAQKNRIAFISLEESFEWINVKLFVSYFNKFKAQSERQMIKIPELYRDKSEYECLFRDLNNISIIDNANYIEDLEKYIIYLYTHLNIDIFFIDYIQRISFRDPKLNKLMRQEQIKHINTILLNLAKEHRLYIISGTQLNRTVMKKEDIKRNDAYREAGDIEQDANLIINLWNCKDDKDSDPSMLYYYIAKNRNGKSNFDGNLNLRSEFWLVD